MTLHLFVTTPSAPNQNTVKYDLIAEMNGQKQIKAEIDGWDVSGIPQISHHPLEPDFGKTLRIKIKKHSINPPPPRIESGGGARSIHPQGNPLWMGLQKLNKILYYVFNLIVPHHLQRN